MESDVLYHSWQKDSWSQRWQTGMEPTDKDLRPYGDFPWPDYTCGFWVRVLAWFVDFVLTGAVTILFISLLIMSGWVYFPHTITGFLAFTFGMLISAFLLRNSYYVLMQSNNGQTIGQAILGIKLVNVNGNPPSFKQAVWRRSVRFISFLTLGFGYLWLVFDKKNQTFHDKLANTYVVLT